MNVRLIAGDMRNVMKTLPAGSIDLIVTDPPYEVITGGNQTKSNQVTGVLSPDRGSNFTGDALRGDVVHAREYIHDFFRLLKDPAHLYLFTNFLNLEENLRQVRLAGFEIHNLLTWKKNNVVPNRWYMKNAEFVIFARKGRAFPIKDKGSKMILEFNSVKDRNHPVEKPVDLLEHLIRNSSIIGDTVLDPFCGSGSAGVAASRAGRRFIGIEKNPSG